MAMAEEPVGMVSCATTTVPEGPASGTVVKTSPSSVLSPESVDQREKSTPTVERPSDPSVIPTVSHESNSESGDVANRTGDTPATSALIAAW